MATACIDLAEVFTTIATTGLTGVMSHVYAAYSINSIRYSFHSCYNKIQSDKSTTNV